jgi:hypothetical protein
MYLNIFPDESLHSYFLRTLFCLGEIIKPSDMKGIVSLSGVVQSVPRLYCQRHNHFNLCDKSISALLTKHLPNNFPFPTDLEELKEYVLLNIESKDTKYALPKGKTRLRYCPDCFLQQITEYGVSWFKLDWLFTISCKEHNKQLSNIYSFETRCCGKPSNVLDCIESAMSGRCKKCNRSYWEYEKEIYIFSYFKQNIELINEKYRPVGGV